MKKFFFSLLLFLISYALPLQVLYAFLIDTGTPTNVSNTTLLSNLGGNDVWLAGNFTLNETAILTDIECYIEHQFGGYITLTLYEG